MNQQIVGYAALFLLAVFVGYLMKQDDTPRLVGYDCEGTSGPIYADEEDHFPVRCKSIEER